MTLLIACLLIYGFNLSGWLYLIAFAAWNFRLLIYTRRIEQWDNKLGTLERELRNIEKQVWNEREDLLHLRVLIKDATYR